MTAAQSTEADADAPSPAVGFPNGPRLRRITGGDIAAAFREGVGDFFRAPLYGLFFGGFYVVGGLVLLACLTVWDTPWAIFPFMIAFPLLGPFVAVGLYEVSRRLSAGEPLSWSGVLGVVFRQKDRQLAWMGMVCLFVFWIWAYQVRLLLALFLGFSSFSTLDGFIEVLTTTQDGITFLVAGTISGAILATVLFSITVISMPLLVDRDLDLVTAMATSVAAVRRNPAPMLGWAAIVTALMLLALAPAFAGLLFVLPVLGHATWRLYERAVVREAAQQ